MKNVVLTRIDDRLLHGQVVVSWIPYLKADEVIIIDDEYAKDEFMSLLIKNAAPSNVLVHILTVDEAGAYLKENDNGSKVLLLLKNIVNLKSLIDLNVQLSKVNVGNMGSSKKRTKYHNTVHLTDEELNLLKEISKQVEVEIKMLPNDKPKRLE